MAGNRMLVMVEAEHRWRRETSLIGTAMGAILTNTIVCHEV